MGQGGPEDLAPATGMAPRADPPQYRPMSRPFPVALLTGAVLVGCHGPGPGAPAAAGIVSGEGVVRAMHDRYADRWYHTLRFRQTVVRTAADGSHPPDEVWLEHADIPGKLRIDQAAQYDGNGVIYVGDSLYVFRQGELTRRAGQRNALLILGFDVYRQPAERTVELLAQEGYDLSRLHADTWQGRPAWVVGAEVGDVHTAQFWIDRERLVFVRLLRPAGGADTRVQDIRFDDYRTLGRAWISPHVRFLVDDKEVMREEYFDIEADPKLPPGLFDPGRWANGGLR
jgi:hypothetical protein